MEGRTGTLHDASLPINVDGKQVELFTLVGAAEQLNLTPMRVLQLIREEKLEARKFGRDWAVLDKEIENFKKRRQNA